jgi:ubiquinone/menaquinone biosynthesis C-methylase UbiE
MMSAKLADYFEWDVRLWSQAMKYWEPLLEKSRGGQALEIGSRRGKLASMLAIHYEYNVVATDLKFSDGAIAEIQNKLLPNQHISFEKMDCRSLTFPNNYFDIVVFKSVLGALGTLEGQVSAFHEIYRVLKPGGALLFAENLKASFIHQYLRKKYRSHYSLNWRYLTIPEFENQLKRFSVHAFSTAGFLTTLFKKEGYKKIVSIIDRGILFLIPRNCRYIIYGTAVK